MIKDIQYTIMQVSFALCCVFFILYSLTYVISPEKKHFPEGDSYIAFVLDVSKSMLVQDIWTQTRLAWAKQKIVEILSQYRGISASLSIFAGESLRILPFTPDAGIFQTFLLSLGSDNLSKQGTNIDIALEDALKAFGDESTGTIIVLTDGDEDTIEIREQTKTLLEKQQVDIIIIGLGTQEWWYIIEGRDPFWQAMYKSYRGERVVARLNRDGLRKLARNIWAEYRDWWDDISLSFDGWWKNIGDRYIWLLYLASIFWCIFVVSIFYSSFKK